MTILEVKQLTNGDEVSWTDPDDGICSETFTIQSIKVSGEIVSITTKHGDYIECFASELS